MISTIWFVFNLVCLILNHSIYDHTYNVATFLASSLDFGLCSASFTQFWLIQVYVSKYTLACTIL